MAACKAALATDDRARGCLRGAAGTVALMVALGVSDVVLESRANTVQYVKCRAVHNQDINL